jgi:hypothetical protein
LSPIRRQLFKHCSAVINSGFIRSRRVPSISLSSLKVRSQSAADAGIVSTSITNFESIGYCCDCSCQYASGLYDLGSSSAIVGTRFYCSYSSLRFSSTCLIAALSCNFKYADHDSVGPTTRGFFTSRCSSSLVALPAGELLSLYAFHNTKKAQ